MRRTGTTGAGLANRRPSISWASPTSADVPVMASSSSRGNPGVTACGVSSRRSRRRCDGGCTSRSPSRGAGWRRLSEAISPMTLCRPTRHRSEHSAITWLTSGAARCRDAVSTVGSRGSGSSRSLMTGFLSRKSFFRGRGRDLPSDTGGRRRYGAGGGVVAPSSSIRTDGGCPVAQVNDLSRSVSAFDPISTLVVVVEMSKASWLVSSVVPGVERQPLKKLEPDATALLRLIERWRNEAVRAGRPISRITLAYEAGRARFSLARWLFAPGLDVHVIHSASVAVSRERKRATTDPLDAAVLLRGSLGWVPRELVHCRVVAIRTMSEAE